MYMMSAIERNMVLCTMLSGKYIRLIPFTVQRVEIDCRLSIFPIDDPSGIRYNYHNREEIEEEVKRKISIAKRGGGYIYHSDHSVPPQVTFENYCYVMEMVNKYGQYDGKE